MDLEKLRLARSLYYQCLGELFVFSFSEERLSKLQEYLKTMQECLFDENLKSNFDILLKHLDDENSIQAFFKEYDLLFLSLKNSIPTTFSYIEEGFENSNPLLCVRQILVKSKIRRNEKFFKESEDAPIAGTRNLENNCDLLALEKDLLSDEKELSEHKMLVDLARNDASKFGTQTRVENLFSIIKNKFVMHIVSEVYANMKEDASIFDVIEAVFPAGTLSGAPKIRALEITSELEDCDRGIYGGAVGFLNFNEDITLAILIRCAFFTQDKAYLASGAGIVLQSESQKEYAEICAKRKALLVAFENLKKENQ